MRTIHRHRRPGALRAAAIGALALGVLPPFTSTPASAATSTDTTTDTATDTTTALDGTWQLDGYGTLLTVHQGVLTSYDTTTVSCLPGYLTATSSGPPQPGGALRFTSGPDGLTITPRGPARAVLKADDAAGIQRLIRIPALPARCLAPADQGPVAVFDRFWATFAENYPFFAAKGIDWPAVRARYRPQVTAATTDAQLQQILTDMIRPLDDAHTALVFQGSPVYFGLRPGTRPATPELRAAAQAAVAQQLTAPEQQFAQGKLGVGRLPGRIGYLRVGSFDGYVPDGTYQQQAAELDRALDVLLGTPGHPQELSGLVLDLRLNGGGSDELGLRIAARLTDHPYTAYTKVARDCPDDPTRFTPPDRIPVQPAAGTARFLGPVTVLTSGSTVSAGETFTQALMGRQPAVTRIGENTQGVFSDVLTRKLSDSWMAVLPNEEYRTRTGRTFDGAGIPPDLPLATLTDTDLAQHRDPALLLARQVLAGGQSRGGSPN
ncbi:S41 family peptidase [Kitasatospora sp. NPDC006697]|uniref:S41 family peptidase n=1 Tax=Kitasatospora sp. NPDC006697 TaxID=3364020 RepID=UPI0036B9497F